MVRKKQADDHPPESWLMSYCDMITLLVTFFLMMMTFSTKDGGDIREVGVGLLKGRGGIWPPMLGASFREELDPAVIESAAKDLDELMTKSDGAVALHKSIDGLTLQFDIECAFDPDSAEPNRRLVESLALVSQALEPYEWPVVVEGSTDSAFEPTSGHPTALDLGLARAEAAARALFANPRVRRERIQVASFGADRPLASNDTALGRRANRGVCVRIVALSITHASRADQGANSER